MRKNKRMIAQFTFYDRTGIQNLLEKQAQKGWMLEKISSWGWKFRRIEPADIHFAVTYFPKASAFDPCPSEEQQRLWEFCEHTGWKLAASNAQLQIFYNENENPVPIETDPQIELENIRETAYRHLIPTYAILFILSVIALGLQAMLYLGDPVSYLSQNSNFVGLLCWLTLFVMMGLEIGGFLIWQAKAQKAIITDGSFVKTFGFRKIELGLMWMIILVETVWLLSVQKKLGTVVLITTVAAAIPAVSAVLFTNLLKKIGAPANLNKILTIVCAVIMAFAGVGVGVIGLTNVIMDTGLFNKEYAETYEYKGHIFKIYEDNLPLMLQDMIQTEYDDYSTEWYGNESLFMSCHDAYQLPRMGDIEQYSLRYTLVKVKFAPLYDIAYKFMFEDFTNNRGLAEDDEFYERAVEIPASEWGAEKAYQLYKGEDYADNEYLLCYSDSIIVFRPDTNMELTKEVKAAVAEKIGGVVVCYN